MVFQIALLGGLKGLGNATSMYRSLAALAVQVFARSSPHSRRCVCIPAATIRMLLAKPAQAEDKRMTERGA